MTIVYVSLLLVLVGITLFFVGKLWLVYYGFRYGGAMGIGVLFVPLFTLWFAFYRLEKEGKELMISLWIGGFVLALVTLAGFHGPFLDGVSGRAFAAGYLRPIPISLPVDPPKKKETAPETTPDKAPTPATDNSATDAAPGSADDAAPSAGAPANPGAVGDAKAPGAGQEKAPAADKGVAPAAGGEAPAGETAPPGDGK